MSNLYVRDKVRGWVNTFSTIPFYDTINFEHTPNDDLWVTVQFGFANSERVTYCKDRIIGGTFNLLVYGSPGKGDRAVISTIETLSEYLFQQTDTGGKLILQDYEPPMDFTQGDGVNWYGAEVVFSYDYYI
jgi:hypothetical protein